MQDLPTVSRIISRVFLGGGSVNFKCVPTNSGANCGEGGNSLKGKILIKSVVAYVDS